MESEFNGGRDTVAGKTVDRDICMQRRVPLRECQYQVPCNYQLAPVEPIISMARSIEM